jgi:histone H3/H4
VFHMEGEVLVVASKVRGHLKERGVKMSGELIGKLNEKVKALLDDAASRAQGNKRATVKPQDV